MKKLTFVFVALLCAMFTFVSCNEAKKDASVPDEKTEISEKKNVEVKIATKEEIAQMSTADLLDNFEAVVEKFVELTEKAKDGQDQEAAQELLKLAPSTVNYAQEFKSRHKDMSPDEMKRFMEIGKRLQDLQNTVKKSDK